MQFSLIANSFRIDGAVMAHAGFSIRLIKFSLLHIL